MKTAEEVRALRLRQLVDELGSIKALNLATGKSERDSTYSQILNRSKSSVTGRAKEMGPAMARAIEEAVGKPRGWMDSDIGQVEWPFGSVDPERFASLPDRLKGRIEERVLLMIEEWEQGRGND